MYVLMMHDYHVSYIIADLTMRPAAWGLTPSSPFRVYGIPTFFSKAFQRGMSLQGAWYIRGAARPVIESLKVNTIVLSQDPGERTVFSGTNPP